MLANLQKKKNAILGCHFCPLNIHTKISYHDTSTNNKSLNSFNVQDCVCTYGLILHDDFSTICMYEYTSLLL
jgi:hypothetical protein